MSAPSDSFELLWTDYIEGTISDEGIVRLCSILMSDERYVREAVDQYQTHRMLSVQFGLAANQNDAFVESVLLRLPASRETLCSRVMDRLNLQENASAEASLTPAASQGRTKGHKRVFYRVLVPLLAIAAVLLLLTRTNIRTSDSEAESVALVDSSESVDLAEKAPQNEGAFASVVEGVRFNSLFHAVFRGEVVPSIGASPVVDQKYVLLSGLIGIDFPNGASAIIESPAAFHIRSEKRIDIERGRCSVHAPDTIAGFEVLTPKTRVLDRGTRFVVDVTDSNDTRVQVVEGAADVYRHPSGNDSGVVGGGHSGAGISNDSNADAAGLIASLREGDAYSSRQGTDLSAEEADFRPSFYRDHLPDRLIGYTAERDPQGRVESLAGLTVQRGGKTYSYSADEIVRADVVSFKAYPGIERNGHVIGNASVKTLVRSAISDDSLVSGLINLGGAVKPPNSTPQLKDSNELGPATPGMAIRFRKPVVNGPGPEVVFFELQTLREAIGGGDEFHVSPLVFYPGLKGHTVTRYDLILDSSMDLVCASFAMSRFDQNIQAIEDLENLRSTSIHMPNGFAIVAVGIDLSDLGYRMGEEVDGLFFQDVDDTPAGEHRTDPVFIGALPRVRN